jgi:hypothetical protein
MIDCRQRQSITIEGTNIDNAEVELLLLVDGKEQSIATVTPGERFCLELPARNTALFRNHALRTASVKPKLTNAVSALSMGYEKGDDGL